MKEAERLLKQLMAERDKGSEEAALALREVRAVIEARRNALQAPDGSCATTRTADGEAP